MGDPQATRILSAVGKLDRQWRSLGCINLVLSISRHERACVATAEDIRSNDIRADGPFGGGQKSDSCEFRTRIVHS